MWNCNVTVSIQIKVSEKRNTTLFVTGHGILFPSIPPLLPPFTRLCNIFPDSKGSRQAALYMCVYLSASIMEGVYLVLSGSVYVCIYVCNGSDSWAAVNVCNKAEQAVWWKTPGVWGTAGSWEMLALQSVCVFGPRREIKTVGEKGVGMYEMCVRVFEDCVWKWNRAGVRLGVLDLSKGVECVQLNSTPFFCHAFVEIAGVCIK